MYYLGDVKRPKEERSGERMMERLRNGKKGNQETRESGDNSVEEWIIDTKHGHDHILLMPKAIRNPTVSNHQKASRTIA